MESNQSVIMTLTALDAPLACRDLLAVDKGMNDDSANVVGREVGHPDAHETWVTVEQLQQGLCGVSRPHFFRGVATVSYKSLEFMPFTSCNLSRVTPMAHDVANRL